MAKLHFIHGCMSASKSSKLIIDRYNFVTNGVSVLVMRPSKDTRIPGPIIRSRMGIECPCVVRDNLNVREILRLKDSSADIYMIDEIHFFTAEDIDNLVTLADRHDKLVFTYGLRVDAFGRLFPASQRLVEAGAKMQELKTNCQVLGCSASATHQLRFRNGIVVNDGPQIKVDDGSEEAFKSVCRKHWGEFFHEGRRMNDGLWP